MHRFAGLAGLVLLLTLPVAAQQQGITLTLDDALERARQSAPAVVAARMRVEEARSRVAGASLRFSTNPTVDVEAGRRSGASSSTDYGVEAGQDIDLPQRRRARIDAAQAGVTQEEQRAREVERDAAQGRDFVPPRGRSTRARGGRDEWKSPGGGSAPHRRAALRGW